MRDSELSGILPFFFNYLPHNSQSRRNLSLEGKPEVDLALPHNLTSRYGSSLKWRTFQKYSLHIILILVVPILIIRADASIVSLNISKSFESDYLGQYCQNNYHCNVSSWCCSEYKCVPGIICQNGQKEINDVCDYQFECFSRCCNKNTNKCSPFMDCV